MPDKSKQQIRTLLANRLQSLDSELDADEIVQDLEATHYNNHVAARHSSNAVINWMAATAMQNYDGYGQLPEQWDGCCGAAAAAGGGKRKKSKRRRRSSKRRRRSSKRRRRSSKRRRRR